MALRKRLLKFQELKPIYYVPKYQELNVKTLWNQVRKLPAVRRYFPEFTEKGFPSRKYFFNVLNTVYPGSVERMVKDVEAIH